VVQLNQSSQHLTVINSKWQLVQKT